jgi:hypothetical protein
MTADSEKKTVVRKAANTERAEARGGQGSRFGGRREA